MKCLEIIFEEEKMRKKSIISILLLILLLFLGISLCGCQLNMEETQTIEEKIKEEINYIENKILTFFSMYAKKEYEENEDLNWDLLEENSVEVNGVLDTVILDMSEIEISNEEIISFKDGVNRLSIAVSNKDINIVLEEYRNLYSILSKFAEKAYENKNEVKQFKLKNLVVSSYVYSENLNWSLAKETIDSAEVMYKEMMDDLDYMKEFSYNLNKIFVLISEVKNAIYLEELELTKIKYINFIEKI